MYKALKKITPAFEKIASSERNQQKVHSESDEYFEEFSTLMSSFGLKNEGFARFRAFLVSEYSEENLDFWLAIEDFKKSKEKELKPKAEYIFKNFIAPNSKNQVNNLGVELPSEIKFQIYYSESALSKDLFGKVQVKVQYLMLSDAYPRFLEHQEC